MPVFSAFLITFHSSLATPFEVVANLKGKSEKRRSEVGWRRSEALAWFSLNFHLLAAPNSSFFILPSSFKIEVVANYRFSYLGGKIGGK
jgi:hypothetical protein